MKAPAARGDASGQSRPAEYEESMTGAELMSRRGREIRTRRRYEARYRWSSVARLGSSAQSVELTTDYHIQD